MNQRRSSFSTLRLADAAIEANRKSKTIETFLAGEGDEIEIAVKNVAIDDLREPPYRATVDFEKVYYTQHDHLEIRRERYVAHFVFVVKERVPNAMIPINPLGRPSPTSARTRPSSRGAGRCSRTRSSPRWSFSSPSSST